MSRESPRKAILVVMLTAVVCSGLVSAAVVMLRPIQLNNQMLDRSRNIMQLTGMLPAFDTTNLEILFLDGNLFRGEPLASLVTATKLRYLNLSGNDFTGPIPDGFVDIPNLVELKLDSNRFNGVIPAWVCENRGPPIVTVADNSFCEPYPPCLDPTELGTQNCDPGGGAAHREFRRARPAHLPQ